MNDLVVLAASAAVVALMVAVAALLGFRDTRRIDADDVERIAAAESARVSDVVVSANGREAIARLSSGRILIVRVVGDGLSSRVAPSEAVRVDASRARVRVSTDDIGYPPLTLRFAGDAPVWVAALAQG